MNPTIPTLSTVFGWLRKRLPDLLVVLLGALLLGEVYLRSPLGREPEFAPDPLLGSRFKQGQETVLGRLNQDGHRGKETDWSQPVVVAIGDSQAFGFGVRDEEVWTTHLARATGWQVVNAAHPGFGPYHQSVLLQRVFERGGASVRAVLIRVSITNWSFTPPSPESLPELQAKTESRNQLRAWLHLIPALLKKGYHQWPHVVAALQAGRTARNPRPRDTALAQKMWEQQNEWWHAMAEQCRQANIPVIFFIHDPTNLPSNGYLQERLEEMAASYPSMSVIRLDSRIWELHPTTSDRMLAEYLDRYSLHWDAHGNAAHHALLGRVMAEQLRQRGILPDPTVVASSSRER